QLVNTLPVTTLLTATIPNQLNPFGVIPDDGFVVDSYDVAVSSWHLTSTQTLRPATVVHTETVLSGDFVYITSTLRNDEAVPLLLLGAAQKVSASHGLASPPPTCASLTSRYRPRVRNAPAVRLNESTAVSTKGEPYRVIGDVANTTTHPVYDLLPPVRLYTP